MTDPPTRTASDDERELANNNTNIIGGGARNRNRRLNEISGNAQEMPLLPNPYNRRTWVRVDNNVWVRRNRLGNRNRTRERWHGFEPNANMIRHRENNDSINTLVSRVLARARNDNSSSADAMGGINNREVTIRCGNCGTRNRISRTHCVLCDLSMNPSA